MADRVGIPSACTCRRPRSRRRSGRQAIPLGTVAASARVCSSPSAAWILPRVHPQRRRAVPRTTTARARATSRLSWLSWLLAACSRGTPPTEVPEPAPLTATEITPEAEPTSAVPEGPLRWRGQVMLPVGSLLEMFVELRREREGYAGTISIPAQGLFGASLGEISVADGKLSFALVEVGARWTAKLEPDGTVVDCVLEQRGASLDCLLAPIDEATLAAVVSPPRPQTPVPPFPYDALEVAYDGSPEEYAAIAETIAPEVLGIVGDWIVAQTLEGPRKGEPKRSRAR